MASTVIYQKRGDDKVKIMETPDLSPYALKTDVDAELATKADAEDLGVTDKRVDNIAALLNGALSAQNTDSTSAYAKTVPAKAQPYAAVNEIGGKTLAWNQIAENYYSCDGGTVTWDVSTHTVTYTVTTPSATSNTNCNFYCAPNKTEDDHKYYISVEINAPHTIEQLFFYRIASSVVKFNQFNGTNTVNTWSRFRRIYTGGDTGKAISNVRLMIYNSVRDGFEANDVITIRNLMWIDLTQMFGAGNEPATTDEFEAMFPASYYVYDTGSLISAGVTSIVSKDAEDATLATLPIPSAVQQLPGYGWGIWLVTYTKKLIANSVDFGTKKYTKNISKITLTSADVPEEGSSYISIATLSDANVWNEYAGMQAICIRNLRYGQNPEGGTFRNFRYGGYAALTSKCVVIINSSDISSTQYRTAFIGVTSRDELLTLIGDGLDLYYQMYEPSETDISAYLTDDNLLAVEPGGTVTFPSQLGDDYRIPVPSDVEYTIDLAPDTPSTDGTYTLQCTVADGVATYEWVSA